MAARSKPQSVSDAVRSAIAESGLSAYALGQLAGVSRSVVSDFVAKRRSLTLETLDLVAPHLGLKVTYPSRRK